MPRAPFHAASVAPVEVNDCWHDGQMRSPGTMRLRASSSSFFSVVVNSPMAAVYAMLARMTEAKRRAFAERLQARRDKLVSDGPAKIEPNRRDPSSVGVADEDEQALSEMLQTLASSRNRDSARELGLVDRALRKLRDAPDDFGVCEDCGDDIADKRLEVMPWASLCAECQAAADPKRGVARKSVTDYK